MLLICNVVSGTYDTADSLMTRFTLGEAGMTPQGKAVLIGILGRLMIILCFDRRQAEESASHKG